MAQAIDQRIEATRILRGAGARFAFLHGSVVTGRAAPGSDLDVAAYWGKEPPPPWEVAGFVLRGHGRM